MGNLSGSDEERRGGSKNKVLVGGSDREGNDVCGSSPLGQEGLHAKTGKGPEGAVRTKEASGEPKQTKPGKRRAPNRRSRV
jgi:hypothetical protein